MEELANIEQDRIAAKREHEKQLRDGAMDFRGALIANVRMMCILEKCEKKLSPADDAKQWAKYLEEIKAHDNKHGLDLPPPKR